MGNPNVHSFLQQYSHTCEYCQSRGLQFNFRGFSTVSQVQIYFHSPQIMFISLIFISYLHSPSLTFTLFPSLASKQNYLSFYSPQTKRSAIEGYVFLTRVCLSFHGGCLPHCMLGYTPPCADTPWADTPPPRSVCWDTVNTSGRYASHWNAILLLKWYSSFIGS